MFLGDADSVRQVRSRLADAAEDVRHLQMYAGRALGQQAAMAGPDDRVLVDAMWTRWDEVSTELRVTISAMDEAVDVLHRLVGQIDSADAEWRTQYAAVIAEGLRVEESAGSVQVSASPADTDAGAPAKAASAQSRLNAIIEQAHSEQTRAGESIGSLRMPSELQGRGAASFGTVNLLTGAAEIGRMTDRLACIHAELETVRGWPR